MYPIPAKSSVQEVFIKFKTMIENQLDPKIKKLQTDNGGEFMVLKSILENARIVHRKSYPYVHQQIGVVERRHRHIVDNGITLLNQAKLPWSF